MLALLKNRAAVCRSCTNGVTSYGTLNATKLMLTTHRGGLTCPPKCVVIAQIEPPCATEFTQTVGADLHVRPKVPHRKTVTALRHPILGNQGSYSILPLRCYVVYK